MDITGTNRRDILSGTTDDDNIRGLGGNDVLRGLGGNDVLDGGNGRDVLHGGAGDNFFIGGVGDDTYVLSGRYETIEVGLGEDRVDLSSFSQGDGYLTLGAHANALGLFAIIDGEEDFGVLRIDNGANDEGLVFFDDLNNALQLDLSRPEGGMGLNGTAYDDTFLIDPGAQGWIQIRPGEGEDLIQIEGTAGTVRLDYSDQTDGIFANLKFGTVIDGSPGFVIDRIVGEGHVSELRATDHDDIIYGGREDETFILRQGDDFVSGGGGVDTVRYDRSGVEAVNVNLGQRSATGIWNGEEFTHTLKNIENIRGSRSDNDRLIGSNKDNQIDGRGGADFIQGKRGDDVLIGGGGNDKFIFRNNDGDDVIVDFNTASNAEKINLRGVSAITSFNDLRANHLTEVSVELDGSPSPVPTAFIDDGAGLTILLQGVRMADLDSGDFIF
ncbi:calcium-binding protein [Sedimentitalea sp. XS_ASV28]|uniref:calcium-binding protein n=1 Tax=Sedimentitalea sp. XS_ASV28 TaxID=3241296 RepID=UPI003518D1D4